MGLPGLRTSGSSPTTLTLRSISGGLGSSLESQMLAAVSGRVCGTGFGATQGTAKGSHGLLLGWAPIANAFYMVAVPTIEGEVPPTRNTSAPTSMRHPSSSSDLLLQWRPSSCCLCPTTWYPYPATAASAHC